jgi:hypothetical protein
LAQSRELRLCGLLPMFAKIGLSHRVEREADQRPTPRARLAFILSFTIETPPRPPFSRRFPHGFAFSVGHANHSIHHSALIQGGWLFAPSIGWMVRMHDGCS